MVLAGTRRAGRARMHPMAFLQRRAHLCTVARGREMFARVEDITPARFDILYLIHEQVIDAVSGVRVNEIAQARLPYLLGLKRQTVWKMVERLVQLGLVKKTKDNWGPDKRRNILSLTPEGLRRVRKAYGVAFSESLPLPKEAPAEEEAPRYWRRPELAEVRTDATGEPILPEKEGREVAKVFTSFAWKRVSDRLPNKRRRYLQCLDDMIMSSLALSKALGDRSALIYPVREPDLTGPSKSFRDAERRAKERTPPGWCEVAAHILGAPRTMPTLGRAVAGRCLISRMRRRRKCRRPLPRPCPFAKEISSANARTSDAAA